VQFPGEQDVLQLGGAVGELRREVAAVVEVVDGELAE
jgi:hypothetical protein